MKTMLNGLGFLAALCMPMTEAANREIRALFQPDPSQPNKNVFINKTPNSGYCAINPSECVDNETFSIQVPIRFESVRAVAPGEGVEVKVPANWRQLTVTNQDTQETETVEIRITGIGSRYALSDSAANLVGVTELLEGHQKLWDSSSWVYAPRPCQYSGIGGFTPATYRFFWKAPLEATCTKLAQYTIPSMALENLDFAYELRTPNPLGMSSGLYQGALSYTVGFGGDFSMGPLMQPDDEVLTLDFVLDVQHTLKVDLPPGGNKVALEPEGGWQRWLGGGQPPRRIYRDQLFYISSSSRFSVTMQCRGLSNSSACSLENEYGSRTQVEAKLSLPAGILGPGGGPVNQVTLRNGIWFGAFKPSHYVDRKPGSLRFEMPSDAINLLFYPTNPPRARGTFRGDITIIWDSEA